MAKSGITWKTKSFTKQALKKMAKKQEKAAKLVGAFVAGEYTKNIQRQEGKSGVYTPTGELKQGVDFDADEGKAIIGNSVKHAIYFEKGTGIHAEDGKGRATPWFYVDSKGVGHRTSGQRPKPSLTPAAENNIKEITKKIAKVYAEITGEDN